MEDLKITLDINFPIKSSTADFIKSRGLMILHFCNASEKVQRISDVCFCKLAVFLSGTICTA